MKFKKIVFMVTAGIALLGSSYSTIAAKSGSALSKNKVIKITTSDLKKAKSGKIDQQLKLSSGKKSYSFYSHAYYGGNPTVIHMKTDIESDTVENWIDQNNIYTRTNQNWTKTALDDSSQADTTTSQFSSAANTFNKILKKNAKVSHKKKTYTLSAKVTNKKTLKNYVTAALAGIQIDPAYKNSVKITKITVKATIKKKHLTKYIVTTNLKYSTLLKFYAY